MAQNNVHNPNTNAFMTSDTRTELTDSLLHTNVKRMLLGIICGIIAGLIMLAVTAALTPVGQGKLWWLQVLATFFCPGDATRLDVGHSTLLIGAGVHFFVSVLLGFGVGKMTSGKSSLGRMFFFGVVLSFLCWLASNMFAPDLFNILSLDAIPQWHRVAIFGSFAMSLLLMMSLFKSGASSHT